MLVLLAVFLVAHVAGALTGSFPILLGTRVVAAVANAGFLAVGLGTAAAMAGPRFTGRATSVISALLALALPWWNRRAASG